MSTLKLVSDLSGQGDPPVSGPAGDGSVAPTETDANGLVWLNAPYNLRNGSFDDLFEKYPEWSQSLPVQLPHSAVGLRLRVPPELGRGAWDSIKVSGEIYTMLVDSEYLRDERVYVPGDRMFKIRILLSGAMHQVGSNLRLDGTGAYLEAYPGAVASEYVIEANSRARLVILNCLPELLTERLGLNLDAIPSPMDIMFKAASGAPKAAATPIGPDVLRAANDILSAPAHFPAHLLRPFIAAKSEEIVCSVLRQLQNAPDVPGANTGRMSVRDVGRTYEARDIILEQYVRPPAIAKLARLVGVNQTKLKASFKAVFGVTIYEFILQCRMERALELLTDSQLSVAEVAYAVGYDYPANFTQTFKRHFGRLPRNARHQRGDAGEGPD